MRSRIFKLLQIHKRDTSRAPCFCAVTTKEHTIRSSYPFCAFWPSFIPTSFAWLPHSCNLQLMQQIFSHFSISTGILLNTKLVRCWPFHLWYNRETFACPYSIHMKHTIQRSFVASLLLALESHMLLVYWKKKKKNIIIAINLTIIITWSVQ